MNKVKNATTVGFNKDKKIISCYEGRLSTTTDELKANTGDIINFHLIIGSLPDLLSPAQEQCKLFCIFFSSPQLMLNWSVKPFETKCEFDLSIQSGDF